MKPTTKQNISKRNRVLLWSIVIPLLAIFVSLAAYGSFLYIKASQAVDASQQELERGEKSNKRETSVEPIEDNISLLLMGVDDSAVRGGKNGVRTDALLLATFNKKDNSIKLVSIPRDTYTYLEVRGKLDRINHAHAFGGVDATVDTVENLLDIPVDYFMKINFEAFMDIVDALGGIEVDVPVTFTEQNSKDEKGAISIVAGKQTLDGEQALALARTRKIDSDIERGKRQQLVMQAIIKKSMSITSFTKYSDLIDALGDNLATNLSFNEMMSFMNYVSKAESLEIENHQLKGKPVRINGIEYYQLDETYLAELQTLLKQHLNLLPQDDQSGTGTESETEKTIITE